MNILRVRAFSYSDVPMSEWEDIIFQPKIDHKFSIRLDDGQTIECAAFEMIERGKPEVHACISTQAGCKFDCHFCSSGKNGFARNLTSAEIVAQVEIMGKELNLDKFHHIVYMGIGEPTDNFENVEESILRFNEDPWYSKRISIATVGLPSKLARLSRSNLPLRMIWVSLHASSDEQRAKLMPTTRSCSVAQLVRGAVDFHKESQVKTWINYMIFHGFNDLEEDAVRLSRLLEETEQDVSVMLTIPNGEIVGYQSGNSQHAIAFNDLLVLHGVKNRIARFFAAGRPVNAGCGEFVFLPPEKST